MKDNLKYKVTIILPTFNSIKYIKDCLLSIYKQSFIYWKLLIFDDGSTDGTLEFLEKHTLKKDNVFLFKRNNSYISNLNEGFKLSDTKYIARMDSDDIMLPLRLQEQYEFMEAHSKIDMVNSAVECINDDGTHRGYFSPLFTEHIMTSFDLLFLNQIVHPTTFFRTDSMKKYDIKYKQEFKYVEDWELWTQMLENKLNIYNLNKIHLKYRIHDNSMSRSHQSEIEKLRETIIKRLDKIDKNV